MTHAEIFVSGPHCRMLVKNHIWVCSLSGEIFTSISRKERSIMETDSRIKIMRLCFHIYLNCFLPGMRNGRNEASCSKHQSVFLLPKHIQIDSLTSQISHPWIQAHKFQERERDLLSMLLLLPLPDLLLSLRFGEGLLLSLLMLLYDGLLFPLPPLLLLLLLLSGLLLLLRGLLLLLRLMLPPPPPRPP